MSMNRNNRIFEELKNACSAKDKVDVNQLTVVTRIVKKKKATSILKSAS